MRDNSRHLIGINIGGTTCSVSVGDASGRLHDRVAWKTCEAPGPEATLQRILEAVQQLENGNLPTAAGVSIGGPLDTARGIVLGPPNLPGWKEVPLKDELEQRLSLPVRVAHDAAACALAEARFGAFNGSRSLVYLTCGTGFGAGVVIDGHMLEGARGLHPEIGHWRLLEDGPVAFGRPGSAEALCSGPGLGRIAAWRHPEKWPGGHADPKTISAAATEGDPDAREVVNFHARLTGRVCAMIAELVCPERILLGSLARHLGKTWVETVVAAYRNEVLERIGREVVVCPASLGDRLQDLSALVVAMEAVGCGN